MSNMLLIYKCSYNYNHQTCIIQYGWVGNWTMSTCMIQYGWVGKMTMSTQVFKCQYYNMWSSCQLFIIHQWNPTLTSKENKVLFSGSLAKAHMDLKRKLSFLQTNFQKSIMGCWNTRMFCTKIVQNSTIIFWNRKNGVQ